MSLLDLWHDHWKSGKMSKWSNARSRVHQELDKISIEDRQSEEGAWALAICAAGKEDWREEREEMFGRGILAVERGEESEIILERDIKAYALARFRSVN